MSSIQEGLVAYLEAQVPSAGKGYPLEVPQDASYPAWSYQVIDDEQVISHGGRIKYFKARIQIDILVQGSASIGAYAKAAGLAASMRAVLDGYKGNMGTVPVKYCKTMLSDDWAELHNLPAERLDVMVHYKEVEGD